MTLALGIGASTAVFSVVNAVLLQPLPYNEADRLVIIWNDYGERGQSLPRVSPPDFEDYQQQCLLFEGLSSANEATGTLTGDKDPEQVDQAIVTANFFSLLRVNMFLGRDFVPEEAVPDGPNVAILSHRLWRMRFGGAPDLVGKSIRVNDNPCTVVGILPEQFTMRFPSEVRVKDADLWRPVQRNPQDFPRTGNYLTALGRLRPGVSLAQAQAEMDGVAFRLRAEHIEHKNSGIRIRVVPLQQDLVKHVRPTLLILLAAVALLLLIACANVANLMLADAASRDREFAVRAALGAGRRRILAQLMTENLLVAILAAGLGLLLAQLGLRALLAFKPVNLPRLESIGIDRSVLIFSLAACVLTPLLFGLAPALQASKTNLAGVLKEGGRTSSGPGRRGLRSILVMVEMALSLLLLIGGGLMVRSFAALSSVHPGFEPENVATFRIYLPHPRYAGLGHDRAPEFFRQLEQRIAALRGVEAAGATFQLPLTPGGYQTGYAWDEESEPRLASYGADWRWVDPGYFQAMGTRLIAGRFFTEYDRIDTQPVAIVDELMAGKLWPNENPIGKRLKDEGPDRRWKEVVGVVEHMRNHTLAAKVREQIYISERQNASRDMALVVRCARPFAEMMQEITAEVHKLDSELAIYEARPMMDYVDNAKAQTRFSLALIEAFGVAALMLAVVGLYSVVSFAVAQRTQEIGVRMALGAGRGNILRLVIGHGVRISLIGVLLGLGGAVALTRLMASLLYDVSATDPSTFGAVALLLLAIAILACYIPARRATRIDPMAALRCE